MEFPSPCAEPTLAPLLERLPLHVFEYICQYVPRHSLASLALTSRFCATAATPRRFARIKITIRDKEKLRDDLQQWNAVLSNGDRFLHVRRLVVVGSMPDGDESAARVRLSPATDSDNDSVSGGDDDDSHIGTQMFARADSPWTETQKRAQQAAWLPFARFLGQLPALKDLVYACTHQMPACVLAALHEHHPRSRLHVRRFTLRSLYQKRDQLHDIDSEELALATSPCLYSIHAICEPYDMYGQLSFNLEAIESMVSGAAPGLRRVHITQSSPLVMFSPVPVVQAPGVLWRGFFPESSSSSVQTSSLARLDVLALRGHSYSPGYLSAWNNRTDFSCLRRLEIFCTLSIQALEALASMAANSKFRSLRTLGLRVGSEDLDESNAATLDKPTSLFLQAVSQLDSLVLHGHFGSLTVHAVLHRHGPTLRQLHLRTTNNDASNPGDPYSSYHNTLPHSIAALCPRLETLYIQIQRHQGRPIETSAYRALGALPRLMYLVLQLDYGVLPYSNKAEMIRATLANCAVDATLARAIFNHVTGAASGSPLAVLRIKPVVTRIGARDLDELARWVASGNWVCFRHPGDKQVVVRKDGKEVDDSMMSTVDLLMSLRRDVLESVNQEYKDVWNEIWPGRGGDWKDEWKSFPLQTQGLDA